MSVPLKKYIETRKQRPACKSTHSETLYRARYNEPPIRGNFFLKVKVCGSI